MGKGAGVAFAALTLGGELKAQSGPQQTWCHSQVLKRMCESACAAPVAKAIGKPVLAHLGELQGVSGFPGRHFRGSKQETNTSQPIAVSMRPYLEPTLVESITKVGKENAHTTG